MHLRALILFSVLVGCGVKRNPEACDRNDQCDDGLVCNLDTNRCEMGPDGGVGCTTNEQCPVNAPVCGMDQMCRSCALDDECASGVCNVEEGLCEPSDRILYVSPTGTSAGTCASTTPCDLAFARTQLTAVRSNIRLANGTYNLVSDFTVSGGTARATIVGGPSAVIQRSSTGPALSVSSGGTLTLRGFSLTRGVGCADAKLNIARVVFDAPTEVRPWIAGMTCMLVLADSELKNSTAEGIALLLGFSQATISGTKITNSTDHGLRLDSGPVSITTSTVTGGMQMAINANNTQLVVSRSLIAHNRRGGITVLGSGSYDITNNFIYRNGNDGDGEVGGLRLQSSTGTNKVRHNTIAFNDCKVDAPTFAGGLYCMNGVASNNLIYNNYSGNATQPNAQYVGNCDTTGSLIDVGTANVQFVSPIAMPFDYHLANVSSAAIGIGITSDVTVDFDGQPRPNGTPDVGADEFHPF
jgi:hypothetical protein